MYFVDYDSRLPIELLCIRLAGVVQTEAERSNLISAWRLCLQHGPSAPRRPIKKALPTRAGAFTKETAGVPMRRLEQLERCLEVMA